MCESRSWLLQSVSRWPTAWWAGFGPAEEMTAQCGSIIRKHTVPLILTEWLSNKQQVYSQNLTSEQSEESKWFLHWVNFRHRPLTVGSGDKKSSSSSGCINLLLGFCLHVILKNGKSIRGWKWLRVEQTSWDRSTLASSIPKNSVHCQNMYRRYWSFGKVLRQEQQHDVKEHCFHAIREQSSWSISCHLP